MAKRPGIRYETYRPKSLDQYRREFIPQPIDSQVTVYNPTGENLSKQKENLESRLQAVGIDPNNLRDSEADNRNFVEKALNLTPDQGLLMDVFEVLNRPQQAVKGLLAEGGEGMIEGLTGEETMTGVEFLDKMGLVNENELDGAAAFAVNLATDIAVDPLTYVRPFKLIGKAAGVSSRWITDKITIKEAVKITQGAGEATVRNVIEQKGKAFLKKGQYVDGGLEIYDTDTLNTLIEAQDKADLIQLSKGTQAPGTQTEVTAKSLVADDLNPTFEKLGLDIKVRKRATAGTGGDLDLFQKVTVDGQDYWVKIDTIEIKGLTPTGKVPGEQPSIRVTENADGTLNAEFTKKSAKQYSENLEKELQEIFQRRGYIVGSDETVLEAYQRIRVEHSQAKNIRDSLADGLVRKSKGAIKADDASKMLASKSPKYKEEFIRANYPEFADDILNAQSTLKQKTKNIGRTSAELDVDGFDDDLRNVFKQLLVDNTEMRQNPFIVYIDPTTNQVSYGHIDDIVDKVDFTGSFIGIEGKETFRIKMFYGENVSVGDIPNRKEEFVQRILNERVGELEKTLSEGQDAIVTYKKSGKLLQFLNAHAVDKASIYNKPAQFALDMKDSFAKLFNAKADFTIQFENQIGRIEGSSAQMVYSYQTQINTIREKLTKIDPEAGQRLARIIESGADFSGDAVSYTKRTVESRKILGDFVNRTKDGNITIVRDFSSPAMQKNFTKNLNDILKANNINNAQFVVKKGPSGGQILDLVGDYDFRDIQQILTNENLIIPSNRNLLNFGIKRLDAEDVLFYNNNQELVKEFLSIKNNVEDLLVSELGLHGIPAELQAKFGYLRHSLSREGKEGVRETARVARSRYMSEGRNLFESRGYDATVDEFNRAMRDFANTPYDVLDDNAFTSTTNFIQDAMTVHRQEEVLKAVLEGSVVQDAAGLNSFFKVIPNQKQFADELGRNYTILNGSIQDEFSKMYKNLSPESQKVFNEFFKNMGYEGKDQAIAVHNSVHNLLSRTNQAYVDLPDIVKQYDAFLNYWKSVTLISPGFHLRNFFGNTTNMYIAGMNAADIGTYMTRSQMDLTLYRQYKKQVIEQGKGILTPDQLKVFNRVEHFYMEGAAQTRKGIQDLDKIKNMVLEGLDPNDPAYKQAYQQLVKINFNTAEYIDDLQRYALYTWSFENQSFEGIAQLKKYNVSEKVMEQYRYDMARQTTVEALFDYSSLTSFERNTMKRLFPFYTFMKNNFVFQAKSLLANPGKYARIGRAYDYWNEDIGGIKTEDMPAYMQDRMWLPIPMTVTKDDEEAISFLKLNLTPSDFTELVRNPLNKGVLSVTAPIKVTFELATGRDVFTGQRISEYPGQKRRMEEGTGVFANIRDDRGNLAISANPYVQKIVNDLGLRVPKNYLSIGFDILDSIAGYQSAGETTSNILDRLSLQGTQTVSSMEITKLYQDLQQLRNLKSLHEQQTGEPLPTLKQLGLQ